MNRFTIVCIGAMLWLQLSAQQSANFGAPKFAPADGKKLLIIGQDLGAVGGIRTHTEGYVDSITTHFPAGVTSYTSLPSLSGLRTFANWGAGDVRAHAYLEDETFDNSFLVIGLYLVGQLEAIAKGTQDRAIRSLAAWVKGQNRPVFIRIGYEFEGAWNNYDPSQFKAAWRQIVEVFDAEQVRNAAYVWQSAGLNYSNIIDWYPGDEYVNWVAFSQFDGGNSMGQRMVDFANAHNKPIMIAEATPKVDLKTGDGEAHWSEWFQPLFNRVYANDRIKALAYINVDWDSQTMWNGQGWGDSRVQVNTFVKDKWKTEIATSPWLTADAALFDAIDYNGWISTTTTQPAIKVKDQLLPEGQ